MFWLSPGVPRSVAPSGIPEPLVDPVVNPDTDVVELDVVEVPDELFAVAEPQPEERLEPPPSN